MSQVSAPTGAAADARMPAKSLVVVNTVMSFPVISVVVATFLVFRALAPARRMNDGEPDGIDVSTVGR